ncbi:hypothetical protein DPMN_176799 [Dreissena polymorpha]|uniref:Uncharacterized protein n=1 Tax=Dreissena polymorpha TaxID=45954 RepID=A0A9D4EC16_DREPO|nr:hypothetical protein DPMN_176799 [Dreissena polymorpha]
MVGEEYEILGVDADDTGGPNSWGFSIEYLVVAQDKDRDLEILLKWMRTQEEPSHKDLYLESNASKAYWINREAFELIDGVLYVMEDSDKKLVFPASLREQA